MTTPVNPDTPDGQDHAPLSISRMVVNQDTGGAITGTDHIDLFWGRGSEAKKVAGVLQHKARMLFLFPKN
jgi:membrane-bound lytic murein transglycosylase